MKKTMLIIGLLAITISCKDENAVTRIDPNAKDVVYSSTTIAETPTNETAPIQDATEVTTQPQEAQKVVDPNQKFPEMTFSKKEHNFGTIKEGDKVETVFTFKNTGQTDLLISDAKGSCGCTVPVFPKEPIKPGKSGSLKVSFDSNGKPGSQQKSVNITCNTASGRDVLTIKAEVTPRETPKTTGITTSGAE